MLPVLLPYNEANTVQHDSKHQPRCLSNGDTFHILLQQGAAHVSLADWIRARQPNPILRWNGLAGRLLGTLLAVGYVCGGVQV